MLLLWTTTLQAAPAFPPLSGRVVDEAALMSRKQAHQLTQQLAAFEKRSGIQLVVVSIDSLDGETIEEYGYQLGRHWGIGQKGKNNGVLLLIAQDERKVRIEVGYGLEGALPDAIAANIIQTRILPAFKRGDMGGRRGRRQPGHHAGPGREYQPVDNASKEDEQRRPLALHPGSDSDDRAAQPAGRRRWRRSRPAQRRLSWSVVSVPARSGGGFGAAVVSVVAAAVLVAAVLPAVW